MTDEPLPPELDVSMSIPDGLKVTAERPYQILLVSDLAGGPGGKLAGPLAERVVDIEPASFDDVMRSARPELTVKTSDPLASGSVLAAVDLGFESLKVLAPKALAEQIPATKALLEAREQIVARLRGKVTAAQLAQSIQKAAGAKPDVAWLADALQWKAAAAPAAESAVDDLLGQLDLGGAPSDTPSRPPPKTPIGAVVAAVASGGQTGIPAEEASALRRALGEIDRRIGAWLNTILHAAPVQRLEAAWRGLAFLVAHIDFRKHIRLSVLHTPRAELATRFRTLLIDPVFDAGAAAPDLILVDDQFNNNAPDIELLDELAQHAASLPAVVLTGVSCEFLGVKNAWQVPTLPPIVSLFDQWQYAKWKTLRSEPYARYLGAIFGRCMLRAPYDAARADDLEFAFREECLGEADFLWTSGAVAAGCTIARSMADTSWPTGMVGRFEGFAVGQGGKKGDKQYGPADTQLPIEKAQELIAGGLNAVIGLRERTEIVVCNGFSAARPERAEGFAPLEVSLPYQLFAGRLSSLLLDLKPHLVGMAREKVVPFVLAHVRDWMTLEGMAPDEQQVAVQARPAEGQPAAIQLAVTVTPPPRILPGGIPIVVGYRLS